MGWRPLRRYLGASLWSHPANHADRRVRKKKQQKTSTAIRFTSDLSCPRSKGLEGCVCTIGKEDLFDEPSSSKVAKACGVTQP